MQHIPWPGRDWPVMTDQLEGRAMLRVAFLCLMDPPANVVGSAGGKKKKKASVPWPASPASEAWLFYFGCVT